MKIFMICLLALAMVAGCKVRQSDISDVKKVAYTSSDSTLYWIVPKQNNSFWSRWFDMRSSDTVVTYKCPPNVTSEVDCQKAGEIKAEFSLAQFDKEFSKIMNDYRSQEDANFRQAKAAFDVRVKDIQANIAKLKNDQEMGTVEGIQKALDTEIERIRMERIYPYFSKIKNREERINTLKDVINDIANSSTKTEATEAYKNSIREPVPELQKDIDRMTAAIEVYKEEIRKAEDNVKQLTDMKEKAVAPDTSAEDYPAKIAELEALIVKMQQEFKQVEITQIESDFKEKSQKLNDQFTARRTLFNLAMNSKVFEYTQDKAEDALGGYYICTLLAAGVEKP